MAGLCKLILILLLSYCQYHPFWSKPLVYGYREVASTLRNQFEKAQDKRRHFGEAEAEEERTGNKPVIIIGTLEMDAL